MESKLTLKMNDDSISRAKKYVASIGSSLSSVVESFFDSLTLENEPNKLSYSPLVQELAGIIQLDENYNYKSDYSDYMEHKYE